MPAHIFIFTAIAIELNTAIRYIRYSRTLNTKVNTHNIAIVGIFRFSNLIYDLSNYLIAFVDNTHSSKFGIRKYQFLMIRYRSADSYTPRFTINQNWKFNAIIFNFEILIINITTRSFENRDCRFFYRDARFLFSQFFVLGRNLSAVLIVLINNRLGITNTLICQSRRKAGIHISCCVFTDGCAICCNRNKTINRIDILVHSCNNKRFLFFCHIKFYCF